MSKKLILGLGVLLVLLVSSISFSREAPPNTYIGIVGKSFRWAEVDELFNLKTSLGKTIAGEDTVLDRMKVEQRFSPAVISTAATTVIKSAPGFVHRVAFTGGVAGTFVCYDNTAASGTKIIDVDVPTNWGDIEFNVSYTIGFTCVTSAATKITVSYR